jgi:lactobin A/cerein 7B family class IIb bacteriocin
MIGFQELTHSELVQVEGGGAFLVGAFVAVVVGTTLVAGAIAYKSASDLVESQQQTDSSSGDGSK